MFVVPVVAAGRKDKAARDTAIDKFHKLACVEPLLAQLEQLHELHGRTKEVFGEHWARAVAATVFYVTPMPKLDKQHHNSCTIDQCHVTFTLSANDKYSSVDDGHQ